MATTHTAEQLINKAAALLGKYVPGEALGPIEHDIIDSCIDDVLAEIAKIIAIGDRDAIPDLVFETVARLVALYAAAEFSNLPIDLNVVTQHEYRLAYLVSSTPSYQILATNYF